MNLINCRVKMNDHHVGLIEGVTPAEVVVLRKMFDAAAGGHCIVEARKAGKALMSVPGEDGKPPTIRGRSSQEEYARLKRKYPAWSAPDKPGTSLIDDLFPGINTGAVELPATFEALPEKVGPGTILEAKPAFLRTLDASAPEPVNEEQAAKLLEEAAQENPPPAAKPVVDDVPTVPEPEDKEGADLSGPLRGTRGRAGRKSQPA